MKLKKVTALLLATSMVLSSVSVTSFADELIFEPEVSATTEAGEDEAYFGDDVVTGDEQNEEDGAADETFFADEVIEDDQVTDDVIAEDSAADQEAYAFEEPIVDENADIYEAIASVDADYDITGDMSVTVTYDGQEHGLDVSKAGVPENEIKFEHPELGDDVFEFGSPTVTHVDDTPNSFAYKVFEYDPEDPSEKKWSEAYAASEKTTVTIEEAHVTASLLDKSYTVGDVAPTAFTMSDFSITGMASGETAESRFDVDEVADPDAFDVYKWDGTKWNVFSGDLISSSGKFAEAGRFRLVYDNSSSDAFEYKTLADGQPHNRDYAFNDEIAGVFTIADQAGKEITAYWPADRAFDDTEGLSYAPSLKGYTFTYTLGGVEYTTSSPFTAEKAGAYSFTITKAVKDDEPSLKVTVTNPTHTWNVTKAKAYVLVNTTAQTLDEFEYGVKDPAQYYKASEGNDTYVAFYAKKDDTTSSACTMDDVDGTAEFESTYNRYDSVYEKGSTSNKAKYYVRYKGGLTSDNYELLPHDDDKDNYTNAFTLNPAEVTVTPDDIKVPYGSDPVEPTYTLNDKEQDSGAAEALQHDIDAGLVNFSVFTSTDTNSCEKVIPKDVDKYPYSAKIEDAEKGSNARLNFASIETPLTSGETIYSIPVTTTPKKFYEVTKGDFSVKFSDYEGIYDGKPHGIVMEPETLPSGVSVWYCTSAMVDSTNPDDPTPTTTGTGTVTTTPITYVDPKDTPAIVYYYVWSDTLGGGLTGSCKVTIKDADQAKAEEVEKQIEEAVTKDAEGKYDSDKVKAAREAYNALTNAQKDLVDPYDVKALKAAEAAVAEQDAADAKAVEEQIAKLPDPDKVTEADKAAIQAAKDAYDALSEDAKAKVSKDAKDKLDADVKAIEGEEEADKKAAKAVEDEIAALPEADKATAADKAAADKAKADYDALTDAQKALVPAEAVEKMNAVKAAADEAAEKEAAAKKEVEALDAKVADVKAAKNGADGKKAAEDAKEAYDKLSPEAKALLTDEEKAAYEATQEAYKKDKTFESGEGVFRVLSNGEVTFTKPLHPENTWFVVPNQVKKNGFMYKVVKVSTKAFMGCEKATKIKIGKNVQSIGAYAFKNTPAMGKLIMLTSKLASGKVKDSFVGAGKEKGAKLTNEVPSGKSSAYESLFKGEGGMNAGAKFTEAN